ncbi:hypothetical protein E2562_013936 [Oryza meyeriana var. granulata]|uniref:NAC domain-containing protein n=1 Tax=Oryza meyeriana var. granulata TaxID=110450 RepID=A0A6G1C5X8_9ORYZ|nr:hypothetical protein E2562_013936 [Oryza meyeriana var. granulata]
MADDGVIEDGEDELRELDLDGGGDLRSGGLVVEVEGVWVAALVGLGVLDGHHEGVGDGRVVGRGGRRGGDRSPWPHRDLRIYVYAEDEVDGLRALLRGRNDDVPAATCLKGQWGTQVKIHQLLLSSRYRTLHKDEADLFFVPTYVKCVRMTGTLNDKEINQTYVKVLSQMPYFRRSGGRDHIFVFPSGAGAHLFCSWATFLNRSIILTPEGDRTDKRGTSAFNTWKDIIIPGNVDDSMVKPDRLAVKPIPLTKRKYLANFLGRAQGKVGRLQLVKLAKQYPDKLESPELQLSGPDKLGRIDYFKHLRNAKFCLAPRGESSWTLRFYESFFVECVPVILSDEVELPFQNVIDYTEVSIKWPGSKIGPELLEYLESIPDGRVEEMIGRGREMRCLWVYAPDTERCSAMSAIMWELQRKRKLLGKHLRCNAVSEIDLYKFAPWDLPEKSSLQSKDREWYFFCPRDRKYSSGSRTNRSTDAGYWKATGKDRPVIYNSQTVGMKRTLVFHLGKPPRGDRTDWVMYEYRLEDKELSASGVKLDACVLCKIFQKSGPGPKIGEQYGAPFNEEDWNETNGELSSFAFSVPPYALKESSNGRLNTAGQQLAVTDNVESSLDPLSETNDKLAIDGVCPDTTSPGIPFDSIHIEQLAEIISYFSTDLLNSVGRDGSLPDSTADYDNDNEVLSDDGEAIFNELDELHSQSDESIFNHCDSCGEDLIEPMLEVLETEQYLELNDLSFSLADDPDPCNLLQINLSDQNHLELETRFEQESLVDICNTTNAAISIAACSVSTVGDPVT